MTTMILRLKLRRSYRVPEGSLSRDSGAGGSLVADSLVLRPHKACGSSVFLSNTENIGKDAVILSLRQLAVTLQDIATNQYLG